MDIKETIQISATITRGLRKMVKELADSDKRSFSQEVELLLTQAVKERERQRAKGRKKQPENG